MKGVMRASFAAAAAEERKGEKTHDEQLYFQDRNIARNRLDVDAREESSDGKYARLHNEWINARRKTKKMSDQQDRQCRSCTEEKYNCSQAILVRGRLIV